MRSKPLSDQMFAVLMPGCSSASVILAFERKSVPPDADGTNDAVPSPRMLAALALVTWVLPTQRGKSSACADAASAASSRSFAIRFILQGLSGF